MVSMHHLRHFVSIPSQVGILLVAAGLEILRPDVRLVSIPSQVGILLVGLWLARPRPVMQPSQYPLRWASSWWVLQPLVRRPTSRLNTLSGGHPLGGKPSEADPMRKRVSIPSQVGILLVEVRMNYIYNCYAGLNTLSGGHPLGGCRSSSCWLSLSGVSIPSQVGILLVAVADHMNAAAAKSQYPLRWASSWWMSMDEAVRLASSVSIPSQVGILLVDGI